MNCKPYQDIIKNASGTIRLNIAGTSYLRIQSDPNIQDFCFYMNDNDDKLIYLSKDGTYEIDLSNVAFINLITFLNVEASQTIIIDTIRERIVSI